MSLASFRGLVRCPHCEHVYGGTAALTSHIRKCETTSVAAPRSLLARRASDHLSDSDDASSNGSEPPELLVRVPSQPQQPQQVPEPRPTRRKAVYSVPTSLVAPLRQLLSLALRNILEAAETVNGVSTVHVQQLLDIPGHLQNVRGSSNVRKTRRRLTALLDPATPAGLRPVSEESVHVHTSVTHSSLPLRRIRQLVDAGCLSRALRLLESSQEHVGIASSDACTREQLLDLFPTRTPDDHFPLGLAESAQQQALSFSQDSVDASLSLLPAQSAAGFSGWTYDLIRQLALGDTDEAKSVRVHILQFANLFMAGKAGPAAAWHMDRIHPLRKSSGGLRPIVVGEAWPRVVTRMAARVLSPSLVRFFHPLQWGIGAEGGPEVVAHAAHLFETIVSSDPTMAVQTVDFKNAFNSHRRQPLHRSLERWAPELLPWFRWSYGGSTPIFFSDGSPAVSCGTGIRQGDPLGCILYGLGTLPMLHVLQDRFPTCFFLADLDDLTVLGPRSDMPDVVNLVKKESEPIGLHVHPGKSIAWVNPNGSREASSVENVTEDGLKLMGTFIGRPEFQKRSTEAVLDDFGSTITLITQLDPNLAYPMLQCCINTRPVYLARTTGPWITRDLFPVFDDVIDCALLTVQGAPYRRLPDLARALRSTRQADGGLGIPRLADICEPAWVASFTQACATLCRCLPALPYACSAPGPLPNLLEAFSIAQLHVPDLFCSDADRPDSLRYVFWPSSPDNAAESAPTPRQRALCQPVETRTSELLENLLEGDPRARAWHLSSSFKGSGSWFAPGPKSPAHSLSAPAFRTAMGLRLLLPATWAPPGAYAECTYCTGGSRGDRSKDHRFHGLNCRRGQGARIARHDAIRDALAQALKRLFGTHAVLLEPRLGPGLKEPDLSLATEAGVIHVDVCVVNPAADHHIAANSDSTPLAAASAGEALKRRQYRDTLTSLGIREDRLVPFVVEATGRLGTAATAFLDRLAEIPGQRAGSDVPQVTKFLSRAITAACMRGNSLSISRSREHAQLVGGYEY